MAPTKSKVRLTFIGFGSTAMRPLGGRHRRSAIRVNVRAAGPADVMGLLRRRRARGKQPLGG
jgi:hypothetical protein